MSLSLLVKFRILQNGEELCISI